MHIYRISVQFSSVTQLCPTLCDPMNHSMPGLPWMTNLYARQQKRHKCKWYHWTFWEKARVGWFERIALKHVYYLMWNRWPVQVRCMKQGTESWCTGTTQRDGIGREIGGVSGWGDTCTPMADSSQCMSKTTTIL